MVLSYRLHFSEILHVPTIVLNILITILSVQSLRRPAPVSTVCLSLLGPAALSFPPDKITALQAAGLQHTQNCVAQLK